MRNIQATGQLYGKTITIKQVSKIAAKKLFAQGQEVYLQSSNMYPFGIWQSVCPIKLDNERIESQNEFAKRWPDTTPETPQSQFDMTVNNYSYYNCDNERGRYIHFYAAI